MDSIAFALPVKPGKAAQLRAISEELLGARRQEFEESERRLGVTRECQFLQPSPMGDLFLFWAEGTDIMAALRSFGQSFEPVDAWWKEQLLDVTGVDLNQPPEAVAEVLMDWSAAGAAAGRPKPSLAMALPVQPGKAEQFRTMTAELLGARRQEFEDSQARLGIPHECWYLQPSPMGDLFLLWAEADDIMAAFTSFVESRDPFDVWSKQQILDITGVDLNQPPDAVPEVLFEWAAPERVR
jgi:hypothetical protein